MTRMRLRRASFIFILEFRRTDGYRTDPLTRYVVLDGPDSKVFNTSIALGSLLSLALASSRLPPQVQVPPPPPSSLFYSQSLRRSLC